MTQPVVARGGQHVKVQGSVYCLSEDHPGAIHREGDTNPYDYPKPSCRLADHRPIYWRAKKGDDPT